MATTSSNTRPPVEFTTLQRDGLRDFIACRMGRDLTIYDRHDDWQAIRDTAEILNDCIPILDKIGWERDGTRDTTYTLEVDDKLRRQLAVLRSSIEGTIADDLRGAEPPAETLRRDFAALEAVALAEAVA